MHGSWALAADVATVVYTALTLGLLIAAVVAGIYAKKQVEQARAAHEESMRPYVIPAIDPKPFATDLFDFSVQNIGQRPAFDVSVTCDPPLQRVDEIKGLEISKVKMLTEPIHQIAPGQKMAVYYDDYRKRQEVQKAGKNFPMGHHVTVTCRDSKGKQYEDKYFLDIDAMQGALFVEEKTVHNIAKQLEKISKAKIFNQEEMRVLVQHAQQVDQIQQQRARQ